ncbi:MAG: hypothetical protein D6808_02015, partial [Candidatus Dadabacteria bacterium]
EGKILLGRKNIKKILKKKNEDELLKRKLKLVLKARSFAKKIGLNVGNSYTTYTKVDKDVLVWVLAGAKPTKFEVYTWWFPFVGTVPYKGFFNKKSAQREALKLQKKGYETYIRGSEAISTLGWFSDPILSTTLKHENDWIVNTVLHELVHATYWVKGDVTFNESLANFVGFQGAVEFFRQHKKMYPDDFKLAVWRFKRELRLSEVIEALYNDLDALYKTDKTDEEKLREREKIFEKHVLPLKSSYPELKILSRVNNSEILQLKFYLTDLSGFKKKFDQNEGNWKAFFKTVMDEKKQNKR